MAKAPISFMARLEPADAARWPHIRSQRPKPRAKSLAESNGKHDQRIALISSMSGGRLSRLSQIVRRQLHERNGHRECERLRSGSVDCTCGYCEIYWSMLEEKLRGNGN
jgi:hypothetical protein